MDVSTSTVSSQYFSSTNLYWIASILSGAVLLYHLYSQWSESKSKHELEKQRIKFVPWGSLLWDAIKGKGLEKKIQSFVKREGPVFGTNVFFSKTIMIAEPELIQQVLSKHFSSFTDRRNFHAPDPIFKNMLFLAGGEDWKRFRTIMTPTFAHGKVKLMKEMIEQTTETLTKNMAESVEKAENGIVEMKHVIGSFTMDTIVQIAFGIKIDSLHDYDNPVLKHAKALFQSDMQLKDIFRWTIIMMSPPLARLLKISPMKEQLDFFRTLSSQIVDEKRALFEETLKTGQKFKPTNFIELLIEAEYECNKVNKQEGRAVKFMTTEEIVAQCVLFFSVGYDTTAMTISMVCYELAKDPEFQELVYKEIQDIYKSQKAATGNENLSLREAFNIDVLAKMPMLNGALSETLRIHNPVVFIERTAQRDITLRTKTHDIDIKKGDVVNIPLYSNHHDEQYFPDPEVFNPYRFIDERTFHDYVYLPFGSGPRTCIGKPLAYVEARTAMVSLINSFSFSTCSKTIIPMQYYNQGDIKINKNVHLKVQKRQ